jgi:hypothetical protein
VSAFPVRRADAHFGFLAAFVSTDNPTSSAPTGDLLGGSRAAPGSSTISTGAATLTAELKLLLAISFGAWQRPIL